MQWGASTDIGLVREVNEDSKLAQPPLFAVADGMGGHLAGDVASGMAIEALSKGVLENAEALTAAVREANQAIYDKASADSKLAGMGTTITAMYAGDTSAQIAHVGDSRAYLMRNGELKRLTQDHTVVGRLVNEGKINPEDADRHPQRSYLERALGIEPDVEIDVQLLDIQPGDRLLLCSDGLFGMIDDDVISSILGTERQPQKAAQRLCQEAVGAGGRDNVTAIVIDYPGTSEGAVGLDGSKAAGAKGAVNVRPAGQPVSRTTGGPRRSGRRLLYLAAFVAVAALASFAAWTALKNSWYVGASRGNVAIFNGVSGSIAGFELSRLESRTDISTDRLPELYKRRVQEGIKAQDRADARSIIRSLRQLAQPTAPPPAPSSESPPSPGAPS